MGPAGIVGIIILVILVLGFGSGAVMWIWVLIEHALHGESSSGDKGWTRTGRGGRRRRRKRSLRKFIARIF